MEPPELRPLNQREAGTARNSLASLDEYAHAAVTGRPQTRTVEDDVNDSLTWMDRLADEIAERSKPVTPAPAHECSKSGPDQADSRSSSPTSGAG